MSFRLRFFALAAALIASAGAAAADDLKIALIYGLTGPLQAYAKQTETGLRLGFEYATKGTMEVDGRKIVIITKDDQGKPDLAKSALAEAYEDDGADIAVGTTSSAAAIAMLPVAEEHKKILVVEPAVADQITGDKWNRYIFRTARNSTPGRDLERGRDRQARRAYRDAGAGLRVRPRRRRGVQAGARQDRSDARRRGICADQHHRLHRPRAAAVRRAEGQARPQDDLDHLGGRRRSARQARRSRPRPLRHRALDRRQHPARACRLQALPRPRRRDLLLLRYPQESGERLARRRASEALQRAAGFLHRRRLRRGDGDRHCGREGQIDRYAKSSSRPWRAWTSTRPRAR